MSEPSSTQSPVYPSGVPDRGSDPSELWLAPTDYAAPSSQVPDPAAWWLSPPSDGNSGRSPASDALARLLLSPRDAAFTQGAVAPPVQPSIGGGGVAPPTTPSNEFPPLGLSPVLPAARRPPDPIHTDPNAYRPFSVSELPGQSWAPYFLAPSGPESQPATEPIQSSELGSLVRRDFPALDQKVNGRRLVWLDNAATTHKPQVVIDRVRHFYEHENSNIHRAAHTLAARATETYENARRTVARFIGAADASEIVFVRGSTEAINLVAHSAGARFVREGDEIVVSELEHHSNIVPWQLLAERSGARIRVLPTDDNGNIRLEELERVLSDRTRIVAITATSNAIGTVVPLPPIIQAAHAYGALVLVDAAQAVAHMPVNVSALDADFFVFSGHKIFGPTGIGALYGKRHLLEAMPPWQGGGSMINHVTLERSTYAPVPAKFEAGTGHIAGAAGLAVALDYVEGLGRPAIAQYEHELMNLLLAMLTELPRVRIIGNPMVRASAVSFVVEGIEPEDVAQHLDRDGIAVRAGHHCAQPALARFGLTRTVRPSIALYNTPSDLEELAASLRRLLQK